jgi:hypothetical protein
LLLGLESQPSEFFLFRSAHFTFIIIG